MKILGIDTSGMVATVAVVCDDVLLAEFSVNYKKTHSETLMPMLDEIIKMTGLDLNDIDAIAVAGGPGSFTGLRIGSATVKGLGMALDIPIVSVPTCHALAYNLWGAKDIVCPIMDARRNQVYTGIYSFNGEKMNCLMDQSAMDIRELIQILNRMDGRIIFTGDGVPVFEDIIAEEMENDILFAPAHLNRQRAGAVATLGLLYYMEGHFERAEEHKPVYLRKSQAEREREERMKDS